MLGRDSNPTPVRQQADGHLKYKIELEIELNRIKCLNQVKLTTNNKIVNKIYFFYNKVLRLSKLYSCNICNFDVNIIFKKSI